MKKYITMMFLLIFLVGFVAFRSTNEDFSLGSFFSSFLEEKQYSSTVAKDQTAEKEDIAVAQLTDVYSKDNNIYVVLDFVTVVPCEHPDNAGFCWINQSKNLRTFELPRYAVITVWEMSDNIKEVKVSNTKFYSILKLERGDGYYSLNFYNDTTGAFDGSYGSEFKVKVKGSKISELTQVYES